MSAQFKLSQYHVATPALGDERQGGQRKRVIFSTRSSQARVIDESLWSAVCAGDLERLPQEVFAELVEAQILVPAEENEWATILDENDEAVRSDRTLYLVVQPTAWCQLGCSYCGQAHTRAGLDAENQDRLVERVRQRLRDGNYESVRICWFGGEPLVGLPVMRALTKQFRRLADEAGCRYSAKIVTNGLMMTPAVAAEMVNEMLINHIEVTLDGSAQYHDRRRHTKSKRATFDRIFRNVEALALRDDLKVVLTVRCNVDLDNRDGVLPLMHKLVAAGIHRRIAQFYVAPVFNWGNDAGDRNVACEEFARWEMEWLIEMVKLGFEVGMLLKRDKMGCMALKPDAELVDPHGGLFNCGEVPLVPAYEEPRPAGSLPVVPSSFGCESGCSTNRYAMGDLAHGSDPARASFRGFRDRIRRGEYPCRECAVLPICGGYCPKKWQDGLTPCPTFKHNLASRLLLAYAVGRLEAA